MADVKIAKNLRGGEIGTEFVTLAGTVEVGDFISLTNEKADANDATILWVAKEAGDSGDTIVAFPVLPGVEFELKTEDDLTQGEICGIKLESTTNRQVLDDGATYEMFRCVKAASAGGLARVVTRETGATVDATA